MSDAWQLPRTYRLYKVVNQLNFDFTSVDSDKLACHEPTLRGSRYAKRKVVECWGGGISNEG